MLRHLYLLLLTGCVVTHTPQPDDTKFDESKRNWVEIFEREIIIAIENQDSEAYRFFMQELVKERKKFLLEEIRIWNENQNKNP